MIQALVIFFVGAELLIVYIWQARTLLRRGARPSRSDLVSTPSRAATVGDWVRKLTEPRTIAILGIVCGILAFWFALPPWTFRSAGAPIAPGSSRSHAASPPYRGESASSAGGRSAWASRARSERSGCRRRPRPSTASSTGVLAATLRFATPLAFAAMGGIFSERSGVVNIGLEGMMLMGAFFAVWGSVWSGSWVVGLLMAMLFGGLLALVHAFFCIHLRADQIVSGFAVNFLALGLTGFLYSSIYPGGSSNGLARADRQSWLPRRHPGHRRLSGRGLRLAQPARLDHVRSRHPHVRDPVQDADRPAHSLRRGASRPPTVGISVYGVRYAAVVSSGMLAALGGAFLSIGFVGTFTENMTAGRGYIALAAVIFGKWLPGWAFAATLLFGFGFASPFPSSVRRASRRTSSRRSRTCSRSSRRRPRRPLHPAGRRRAPVRQG